MAGTTPTAPILSHKHSERSNSPIFVDVLTQGEMGLVCP